MSVLLLTGTCASGKTTVGELLEKDYGYHHIDGDDVWNAVKLEQGKGVGWNEIHQDILNHCLQKMYSSNVVITHVIYPEIFPVYTSFFERERMAMTLVVLVPTIDTVYQRNNTRTCWSVPTPQKYIDDIYGKLSSNEYLPYFLDTTHQKPEQTVSQVLNRIK
jgi:gluconate kinase